MNRRKTVLLLMMPCLLAMLACAAWIGFRYLETENSACDCEDPVDGARFALLNPFRDRAPENAAIQVIRTFQAGKCQEIPQLKDYCKHDRFIVMSDWKLTGKAADPGGIVYRFWVTWTVIGGNSDGHPVWVTVQPDGKGWKTTDVSTYF
jgi:hypothetical protein